MSRDAQKHWTKSQAMGGLKKIDQGLSELEPIVSGSGKMPSPLRKKVITAHKKVLALIQELKEWSATDISDAISKRHE